MFDIDNKENVFNRFNNKFIINSENGCWEWNVASRGDGYGCMRINHKTIEIGRAHV